MSEWNNEWMKLCKQLSRFIRLISKGIKCHTMFCQICCQINIIHNSRDNDFCLPEVVLWYLCTDAQIQDNWLDNIYFLHAPAIWGWWHDQSNIKKKHFKRGKIHNFTLLSYSIMTICFHKYLCEVCMYYSQTSPPHFFSRTTDHQNFKANIVILELWHVQN